MNQWRSQGSIPVTGIKTFQANTIVVNNDARTRGKMDYLGKIEATTKILPYGAGEGNRTLVFSLEGRYTSLCTTPAIY